MKIYGDTKSFFNRLTEEQGLLYGKNDVLQGPTRPIHVPSSASRPTHQVKYVAPKLYLHIPKNLWTTFTGKLREHLLPYRWKTAYLDREKGKPPVKILVCTSNTNVDLSSHLKKIIGKPLFLIDLMKDYKELVGKEFLCFNSEAREECIITHFFGERFGKHEISSHNTYCHIYRPRDLFSSLKYIFLKIFPSSWKEITIEKNQEAEKILIKKSDEAIFFKNKLISLPYPSNL